MTEKFIEHFEELVADAGQAILDEAEFRGKFRAVVFAILEKGTAKGTGANGKFAPFYRLFGSH